MPDASLPDASQSDTSQSDASPSVAPELRISEIRPDALDGGLAFAAAHGGKPIDRARVRSRWSLVAHDPQGELRGTALCVVSDRQRIDVHVVVTADDPTALARQLIDKALGKMRCDHVHRCTIDLHYAEDAPSLWHVARWPDDAPRAPAASR